MTIKKVAHLVSENRTSYVLYIDTHMFNYLK